MKKLISMLIATLMVVSMGTIGFAEESGIKVILDGKAIEFKDAKPMEKEGRVMVPFATIFEAMGAAVKYENNTIIATLDNKEIRIKENSITGELITNGKSEIIDMKVPAYVEKNSDRAYVPVSTISLGFGFDVYWDETTKSVNIINSKKLIDEMNAKYTIYNKIMNTNYVDMEKTYKTDMNANLDVNIDKELTGGEKDMILAAKANIEAISKGLNVSMSGEINVDTVKSTLTDSLGETEGTLEKIPFNIIMDSDQGNIYMNLPLEMESDKSMKNTWIKMSIDPTMAMAFEQVKSSMSGKTNMSIGELAYTMAWEMKETLSLIDMNVYDYVKEMEKIYDLIIADELFKTTKEGSTNVYTIEMNKMQIMERVIKTYGIGSTEEDIKIVTDMINDLSYKMVIKEKDGKLVDMSMDIKAAIKNEEEMINMEMNVKENEENSDMTMKISLGNTKIEFKFNAISSETKKDVQAVPPVGAEIVDFASSLNSVMGVIGGADGPTSILLPDSKAPTEVPAA